MLACLGRRLCTRGLNRMIVGQHDEALHRARRRTPRAAGRPDPNCQARSQTHAACGAVQDHGGWAPFPQSIGGGLRDVLIASRPRFSESNRRNAPAATDEVLSSPVGAGWRALALGEVVGLRKVLSARHTSPCTAIAARCISVPAAAGPPAGAGLNRVAAPMGGDWTGPEATRPLSSL